MTERNELERLNALDARIAKAKATLEPPRAAQDHHSMAQIGWRMVIEMVAGLGVGAAMGYGLDILFGTMPIFLVLLTLLGFGAGVQTMLRSAREFQTGAEADAAQRADGEQRDRQRGE
ncbi:MAG: AtpZ/AtpI family protein [Rhodobacteraceae bacterium]|nr:AtpZ/AtpI family protein [Paracoccaceae bacterium]TVR48899.1 MAG: F0F1 ATP synthase subunit I [Paracoccaceae bacterium]